MPKYYLIMVKCTEISRVREEKFAGNTNVTYFMYRFYSYFVKSLHYYVSSYKGVLIN